jgi:hypothetical protein
MAITVKVVRHQAIGRLTLREPDAASPQQSAGPCALGESAGGGAFHAAAARVTPAVETVEKVGESN